MQTVTLWNVAQFGWTCVSENDFGLTAITTWTRDDQVLTLAWQGVAEVSAAILDGHPLPLDDLLQQVADSGMVDDAATVLERAGDHAMQNIPGRLGPELGQLLTEAAEDANGRNVAQMSRTTRHALHNVALAVLSTPAKPS